MAFRQNAHSAVIRTLLSLVCATLLLLNTAPNTTIAQQRRTFGQHSSALRVVESSPVRLVLEYAPFGDKVQSDVQNSPSLPVPANTLDKHVITSLKSAPTTLQISSAQKLRTAPADKTVLLAVPSPSGFRITSVTALNVQLRPASEFTKAAISLPASNEAWGTLVYTGISRENHLATLTLRSARFDAQKQCVQLPERLRITIEFDPPAEDISLTARQTGTLQTSIDEVSANDNDFAVALNHKESAAWRRQSSATHSETSFNTQNTTPAATTKPNGSQIHSETAGRWAKITVAQEGIYRITASQLAAAGITVSPQELSTLRIFGMGGEELPEAVSAAAQNQMSEQPVILDTSSNGQLNAVIFYAAAPNGFRFANGEYRHFINQYSRTNAYLVNVGSAPRTNRAAPVSLTAAPTLRPRSYMARYFWEEDSWNPYGEKQGSGRRWFGRRLSDAIATNFLIPMPNLVTTQNAPSILYRICAAWNNPGGGGSGGAIDVRDTSSGAALAPFVFSGADDPTYGVGSVSTLVSQLPPSLIRNNRSVLQLTYRSAAGVGADNLGALDWFEVHYPREFVALGDTIDFFTDDQQSGVAEYTIQGFSGGTVYIVETSNRRQPVLYSNQTTTGGTATFRADVVANSPKRFYASSRILSPISIERASFIGLRQNPANAELIIITDSLLLPSAQAYQQYRTQTGMSTTIVTTEQIYNEFNAGTLDPTALRDYLALAFRTWQRKPKYVLFWGDGHFDYRNISRTSERIFVPTYQSYDPDGTVMNAVNTTYSTEDYFARIAGDDPLVDIAIGRLCVRSNEEGALFLSKIRRYESTSSNDAWRTLITMVADDSPAKGGAGDGDIHTAQSELLSLSFPADIRQRKLYLPDFPPENIPGGRRRPSANQALLSAINSGTLVLNWIGHGNPVVWAHEEIFNKNTSIPLMTNLDRLFFLTAATCDFSRFDEIGSQSGSEELLSSSRGGAIGIFGSTRTVYAFDNANISRRFYDVLFANSGNGLAPRLGDIIFAVKQEFFAGTGNNDIKFCLLGDPTVRLALPEKQVTIATLNGVNMTSVVMSNGTMPQLKALSTVEISGAVLATGNRGVDSTFNGNIIFTLHDTDINKIVNDIDATVHRFTTLGGLLNFSAAPVRNGRFTSNIVIPKDISFTNQTGRLFAYTVSSDNRLYGRGATTAFTIGGVDTTATNDGKGPDIKIFMDNRNFRPGDYVQPKTRLIVDMFDETGINATGSGIGHDIEYWLNDNPLPVNLTSVFLISLQDPRRGTVEQDIAGLKPGTHRIRVRAWDVFNNFSESETYFRVGNDGATILTDMMNYPNPFVGSTTVRFRHNQLNTVPVTIAIYALNGTHVRTLSFSSDARTIETVWDGTDETGRKAPAGIYLYRVMLTGDDGAVRIGTGKMVISQ